jgi:hypothetical protein
VLKAVNLFFACVFEQSKTLAREDAEEKRVEHMERDPFTVSLP